MDFLASGNNSITNAFDANSMSGNVAKAIFCIRAVSAGKPGTASAGSNLHSTRKAELDRTSEKAQTELLKKASEKLKTGHKASEAVNISDVASVLKQSGFIPFEVQYNPVSLTISSESGGTRRYYGKPGMGSGGDNQMETRHIPKRTILKFTLVMERINVNNAFVNSSETIGNASIGNLTSTYGSTVNRLTPGSEKYSIRDYLEGFMGLLATTYTRDMIFFWGQTCFHGELTSVSTRYKMFNSDGDPILGEIDITLTQHDFNNYDNLMWERKFEQLFDEDTNGQQSMSSKLWSGKGVF